MTRFIDEVRKILVFKTPLSNIIQVIPVISVTQIIPVAYESHQILQKLHTEVR